jgi:hypothetical protein
VEYADSPQPRTIFVPLALGFRLDGQMVIVDPLAFEYGMPRGGRDILARFLFHLMWMVRRRVSDL